MPIQSQSLHEFRDNIELPGAKKWTPAYEGLVHLGLDTIPLKSTPHEFRDNIELAGAKKWTPYGDGTVPLDPVSSACCIIYVVFL